jgi:hypothetical protein
VCFAIKILTCSSLLQTQPLPSTPHGNEFLAIRANKSLGELCPVEEKSAVFSGEKMKSATGHYCSATHMERRSFAAETPAGEEGNKERRSH